MICRSLAIIQENDNNAVSKRLLLFPQYFLPIMIQVTSFEIGFVICKSFHFGKVYHCLVSLRTLGEAMENIAEKEKIKRAMMALYRSTG